LNIFTLTCDISFHQRGNVTAAALLIAFRLGFVVVTYQSCVAFIADTIRSDEWCEIISALQSKEFFSLTTAELPVYERRTVHSVGLGWDFIGWLMV
jgi:hypothetical protein